MEWKLTHVSPVTIGVMYGTGLLMSLSPCALSLLPLTISYIAGSEAEGVAEGAAASAGGGGGGGQGGFDSVKSGFVPSAAFAAGVCACVYAMIRLSLSFAFLPRHTNERDTSTVLGARLRRVGGTAKVEWYGVKQQRQFWLWVWAGILLQLLKGPL